MRCRVRYRYRADTTDRQLVGDYRATCGGRIRFDIGGEFVEVHKTFVRTLAVVTDDTPLQPPHELPRRVPVRVHCGASTTDSWPPISRQTRTRGKAVA